MIPKIKFKIPSKDKIAEFIFDLKNSLEIENLSQRDYSPCIHIELPNLLVKKILVTKSMDKDLKEEIKKEINISDDDILEANIFIKKMDFFWNENIHELFFLEMNNLIGSSFFQPEYSCYITDKVVGAYFGNNDITIDWDKSLSIEKACFILAEEILHLIYWQLWKKLYKRNIRDIDKIFSIKGDKWSCWHMAEIIPEYILVNNPVFEKFGWNKRKRYFGYKWIPYLQKELDPIWKTKKNFEDFVIKAHKTIGINI